jgi:uncharacterized protein YraI
MKLPFRFAWTLLPLAALSLGTPAPAHAADGYVTGNVSLRAGPAPDYPLIALIPAGTEVDVQGCTEGWEWCDVIAYDNRGWVAGNFVEYEYQDQPVLLPAYGAQIGIPIVTFVIGSYWDNHYRGRPFYRDRDRWYHRPIAHGPPPPPLRHPYRPPSHGSRGDDHSSDNRSREPMSHRPMPGPITPPADLRPTRPAPSEPQRERETGRQPAGYAVPQPAPPGRNMATPSTSHSEAPSHAPADKPQKGNGKAGDRKDDHHDH